MKFFASIVAFAAAKPALEIRLAPPADIYPEVCSRTQFLPSGLAYAFLPSSLAHTVMQVQAAISALDAKREAAESRLLAAVDAAGSRSFLAKACVFPFGFAPSPLSSRLRPFHMQ